MPVRNAVRHYRQAQRLSIRALAERAAVDPSLLSRVERQRATVSDAAKVRLAMTLGVSIAALWYPDYVDQPSTPDEAVPA